MNTNIHSDVLQEVRLDIAELEKQLAGLRAVEAYHAAKCGAPAKHGPKPEHTHNGQTKRFKGMGQREAATIVMREAGKPMRTGDIARAMLANGFEYADVAKLSNSLFT